MSWIHNALKDAELARPREAARAADQVLSCADCPAPKRASNLALALLIAAVMSLSGFMTWEWFRASSTEMKVRARSYDSGVNPVSGPVPLVQPPVTTAVTEAPKPVAAAKAVAEEKSAIEAAANPAVAPESPKPAPMVYKLQGVIYVPGRCSAVINGKTVVAGERVGDARVVSIDKDTAMIVTASGQTNVLDLE